MTVDLFSKAVREALRETLPGNDNGSAGDSAPIRVEHSGTVTLRIELADASALVGSSRDLRALSAAETSALLARLESFRPIGRTYERRQKTLVLHPTAEQRARVGGRPLR